jgi:hypothetical protein
MNLSYIDPPTAFYPTGRYFNEDLNQYIVIADEQIRTPDGGQKYLLHKSDKEFYIHDLPVIIRLVDDGIVIEGEQLCDRWTTTGTVFQKV